MPNLYTFNPAIVVPCSRYKSRHIFGTSLSSISKRSNIYSVNKVDQLHTSITYELWNNLNTGILYVLIKINYLCAYLVCSYDMPNWALSSIGRECHPYLWPTFEPESILFLFFLNIIQVKEQVYSVVEEEWEKRRKGLILFSPFFITTHHITTSTPIYLSSFHMKIYGGSTSSLPFFFIWTIPLLFITCFEHVNTEKKTTK